MTFKNRTFIITKALRKITLCLIYIVAISASRLHAQTAQEIINKYLDTVSYGDASKWSKVKSVFTLEYSTFISSAQLGTPTFTTNDMSAGYTKTYKLWPDMMKTELYSDSICSNLTSEFYFYKDRKVVLLGNMAPMYSSGDNSKWFDLIPVTVQKIIARGRHVNYNGTKTIPGIMSSLHEVEIQSDDDIRRLYFNQRTYLLEAITFVEGGNCWIYSDYKYVDGFLVPMRMMDYKNGSMVSNVEYIKMEFNPKIDKIMFKYR